MSKIRNWFAYNRTIWLRRGFVIFLQFGKRIADLRPCPECGRSSLVLISKRQAVLLCKTCEKTFIRKLTKKAPKPAPKPVKESIPPESEAVDESLPTCLCCDRHVESKRHKYCPIHKGMTVVQKREQMALYQQEG